MLVLDEVNVVDEEEERGLGGGDALKAQGEPGVEAQPLPLLPPARRTRQLQNAPRPLLHAPGDHR